MQGLVKRIGRVGYGVRVLVFFICTFVLLASGRLDNFDPAAQLQAATAFVWTGSLGVKNPALLELPELWMENRQGTFYEMHDLGGAVLMIPAATVGRLIAPAGTTPEEQIRRPSWESRFAVAISYAALSGLGCYFLFLLFAQFYPQRSAFLLTVAFAFTTIYWPYTKSSFDVMGACVGVAALLAACGVALNREGSVRKRDAAAIALTWSAASLFRYSIAPFLFLGVLVVLYALRRRLRPVPLLVLVALLGVGFLPTAWYNLVRTSEALRTATTGQYAPTVALQGSIVRGMYGLWISPNRGLIICAPIFLLLFLVPFVWRRIPEAIRTLLLGYGLSVVTYTLVIAKMTKWSGGSGWGPRYLVPVLPIVFLGVAAVLAERWPAREEGRVVWRRVAPLAALLTLSGLLCLAPVLVNHRLASMTFLLTGKSYDGAFEPTTPYPAQQMVTWWALVQGVQGHPLPAPPNIEADPIRGLQRNFPDLWLARLLEIGRARHSLTLTVAALVSGGLLLTGTFWALVGLLRKEPA
jgi:hypothetical protein